MQSKTLLLLILIDHSYFEFIYKKTQNLFKISDIFKEIDHKPIGTASLAQCHRAILHDGTVVAVKIQHPKVKSNSYSDIRTMSVRCLFYCFF